MCRSMFDHRKTFLIIIFFLSLSFRLIHIFKTSWIFNRTKTFHIAASNRSIFNSSDTDTYEELALRVVRGKGSGVPYNPPFTIFFLASLYRIFGKNPLVPKVIFAVLSSFAVTWVVCLGEVLFDKTVARIAGIISAVSFNLIAICGANNTEPVYGFLLTGFFYFMFRKKRVYFDRIMAGIFGGMTILTRSEFLLILFLVALFELFFIYERKWFTNNFVLPYLIVIIFLIPWTVRNYIYMGEYNKIVKGEHLSRFVPLTLNGPFNFFIGNNPFADGGFNLDFMERISWNKAIDPASPSQMKFVMHGYSLGISYILANPISALNLFKDKIVRYIDGFSGGYFCGNYPNLFPGERKNTAEIYTSDNKIMIDIHLIIIIIGIYLSIKIFPRSCYILLIPIVSSLISTVVFFGLARMLVPYFYFYSIFLAVPFANWQLLFPFLGRVKQLREVTDKAALLCTMFVLLLMAIIEANNDYNFNEEFASFSLPILVSKSEF